MSIEHGMGVGNGVSIEHGTGVGPARLASTACHIDFVATAAQLLLDWPDWFHIRARDMLGTAGNSRQPNAYQQSTLVTHQRDGGGGKAGEQGNECSTRLRT